MRCVSSRFDNLSGRLHYIYLDHVHHPSLRSIRVPVFFKLCRLEGISFDLCTQVNPKTRRELVVLDLFLT